MMTREEALAYGMSFDNVYEEKPFVIQTGSWCGSKEVKKHFCGSMNGKAISI